MSSSVSFVGTPLPSSVTGSGTAAQTFAAKILVPGSGRTDGSMFVIRAAGDITPNTASTAALTVYASYPAGQYPAASITQASLTNNVVTYLAVNNFVANQLVTVAGCTTSTFNVANAAVVSANASQFTVAVTHANISNEAETASSGTLQPIPVYAGAASGSLTSATTYPFRVNVTMQGTSGSKLVQSSGDDETNGVVNASPVFSLVPGVNFSQEPPLVIQAAVTFGSSNAGNSANLKQFILEQ